MKYFFYLFLALPLIFSISARADSPLAIRNQSNQEIINILATPQKGEEFFMRLDLSPGKSDKIKNPDCVAALRVDTGLEFWLFPKVNLKSAQELVFCADHHACIILLQQKDGNAEHINGKTISLVPTDTPVCELGKFRPRMAMKDVCAILAPDTPVDDNGAYLAGLGFGGMLWAGRLSPAQSGKNADNALLEHLELRRPLSDETVDKLLSALFQQGYTPWQAEFPGLDMDFAELTKQNEDSRESILRKAVARFLQNQQNGVAATNAAYRANNEASILMAPVAMLPSLANADAPDTDVQLFTIVLQPASRTLLVDVAAYEGEKK